MNNNTFLDTINQILHNEGIEMNCRLPIVMNIYKNVPLDTLETPTKQTIYTLLHSQHIQQNELFQMIYMYFGNKHFKKQLDQFYTPITICEFLQSLCIPGKSAIDPACGTGDLLNTYQGKTTLCDKSTDVIEITKYIHQHVIQNPNTTIRNIDSLYTLMKEKHDQNNTWVSHDYCLLNPPFGTKTIVNDPDVLRSYALGNKHKKQEMGLLFLELGMKVIGNDGILGIILPNGYLGNKNESCVHMRKWIIANYRLIGIIKLPDNSFSRSGTGVSTSILLIEKSSMKKPNIIDCANELRQSNHKKIDFICEYNVFIAEAVNIGYILNKKNTPLKYKTDENGDLIYDANKHIQLDNDLHKISQHIKDFCKMNHISGIKRNTTQYTNENSYETISIYDIIHNDYIFDIKRYQKKYRSIINRSIQNQLKKIRDYIIIEPNKYKYTRDKNVYYYIDISCVNTPLYRLQKVYSQDLPSRAKYNIRKNDIIISKLKGKLSFTVIQHDYDNIIVSNGFTVLRPQNTTSMIRIFCALFSKDLYTQHQHKVTGSIMETLSDDDIFDIYIEENETSYKKYESILKSVSLLNIELNSP